MRIVDLSQAITPNMPTYPGTKPPKFTAACTIDTYGFTEKHMIMSSHTGTHLDAPAHVIAGAKTLDQMGIDRFIARLSKNPKSLDFATNYNFLN